MFPNDAGNTGNSDVRKIKTEGRPRKYSVNSTSYDF